MTRDEVDELMRLADQDGSGSISMDEFRALPCWVTHSSGHAAERFAPANSVSPGRLRNSVKNIGSHIGSAFGQGHNGEVVSADAFMAAPHGHETSI